MITGTGGQGVIAAADFLSQAIFMNGLHVVNTRSYGAEARGGSARSEVIASDEEIYDIQFEKADIVVFLSLPAYRKFSGTLREGGLAIVDTRVAARLKPEETRRDVQHVQVPAADVAERLGNPIVANMVTLGALAKQPGIISVEQLKSAVRTVMCPQLQEINLKAIDAGAAGV